VKDNFTGTCRVLFHIQRCIQNYATGNILAKTTRDGENWVSGGVSLPYLGVWGGYGPPREKLDVLITWFGALPYLTFGSDVARIGGIQRSDHQVGPLCLWFCARYFHFSAFTAIIRTREGSLPAYPLDTPLINFCTSSPSNPQRTW